MQSSATAVTDFQLPASSAGLSVNAVTVDEVHAPSSNSATGMEATAASVDSGRHSKIGTLRRAFCLLVLFDLIFTCILWIFYTKYLGLDLGKAIRDQVLHYQFTSSVFDLVPGNLPSLSGLDLLRLSGRDQTAPGVSLVRFILLEVFYAALRLQSPWVVAVTTAFSTAFIIVKIILYDYDHGHSVFDYLLPIMSLVLVWIETFLLDCKVLPKERADEQLNERSPLLSGGRSSSVTAEYVYRGGLRHSFVPSEGFVTPQSSP
uniref:MENTAL domain-containing protein n=1 Tax=Macrostomum lignano TaxID=282301 RepID=A0A1I8I606_9PLAT